MSEMVCFDPARAAHIGQGAPTPHGVASRAEESGDVWYVFCGEMVRLAFCQYEGLG